MTISERGPFEDRREPLIAQMQVDVPGLMPETKTTAGIQTNSTLERSLPTIAGQLLSREGSTEKTPFEKVIDDVRSGKKNAVWAVAGVGAITITVAVAYELGVRHGKDIRELYEKLLPHRPKAEPKK